jgi:hypothetical protein
MISRLVALIFSTVTLKDEYCVEQYRNEIDGERLESHLHVATSQISPDINMSVTHKHGQFSQ